MLRARRTPGRPARVRSKLRITVESATPSAKEKVEAAGGAIVAPAA